MLELHMTIILEEAGIFLILCVVLSTKLKILNVFAKNRNQQKNGLWLGFIVSSAEPQQRFVLS